MKAFLTYLLAATFLLGTGGHWVFDHGSNAIAQADGGADAGGADAGGGFDGGTDGGGDGGGDGIGGGDAGDAGNADPIADAGDDQTVNCDGPEGALVTLDGSGSFDPDGDDLEFEWSVSEGSGAVILDPTAAVTDGLFPVGVHHVTLTVYDGQGGVDVASVTIIVVDEDPPVAMVSTDVAVLWPPNHKMASVLIDLVASDQCTEPEDLDIVCTISSDSDGTGKHVGDVNGEDGFTSPVEISLTHLGEGIYTAKVELRAERDGEDKAGRVYSIDVEVTDGSGNLGETNTAVVVPHNRGKK